MRFLTIILSVYILVLSLAPCGDDIDCSKHANNKTEQTSDTHDHKSENCSPFCICACCGHISNVFSEKMEAYKFNLVLATKIQLSNNETLLNFKQKNRSI